MILVKLILFNQDHLKNSRFHSREIRRSSRRRFFSSKSYLIWDHRKNFCGNRLGFAQFNFRFMTYQLLRLSILSPQQKFLIFFYFCFPYLEKNLRWAFSRGWSRIIDPFAWFAVFVCLLKKWYSSWQKHSTRIRAPLGDATRVPEKSICRDDKRSDLAIS